MSVFKPTPSSTHDSTFLLLPLPSPPRFQDSGALAIDLNVLFGLNYHETMAQSLAERTAQGKTDDGVSLGGAFWTSNDPFSSKKDELSKEEKRALDLVEKGKKEIAEMHNINSDYLKIVSEAANSNQCRDKVWLCTEVPKSSRCAFIYHWFSLVMTLFSILLFLAETTPEYNDYREGGRVCKEVVKYHCEQIYNIYNDAPEELRKQAYLSNLGCWSSEFQKAELNISLPTYMKQEDGQMSALQTGHYGGCWKEDGFLTAELDAGKFDPTIQYLIFNTTAQCKYLAHSLIGFQLFVFHCTCIFYFFSSSSCIFFF